MEVVEFLSYGVEALRAKVASDFHRRQTILPSDKSGEGVSRIELVSATENSLVSKGSRRARREFC